MASNSYVTKKNTPLINHFATVNMIKPNDFMIRNMFHTKVIFEKLFHFLFC